MSANRSGCVDPTPSLIFRPVGFGAGDGEVESEFAKKRRRHGGHRSVSTVERDTAREQPAKIGKDRAGVIQIFSEMIGRRNGAGITVRHRPRLVRDDLFDTFLEMPAVLHAGPREHLDAVVLIGIVRRRNHDAGVKIERPGQIRHGRRRRNAEALHHCAGDARPVGELALNPLA